MASISIKIQRNVTGKPKVSESITFKDDVDLIDILPELNEKIKRLRDKYEVNIDKDIKVSEKKEEFKFYCTTCGSGFNEAVNKNTPDKCPVCAIFT